MNVAPVGGAGVSGSKVPVLVHQHGPVGAQTSRAPNLGVHKQQSGTLAALSRSYWLTISVCWIANNLGVGDSVHSVAVYVLVACSLWNSSCALFYTLSCTLFRSITFKSSSVVTGWVTARETWEQQVL